MKHDLSASLWALANPVRRPRGADRRRRARHRASVALPGVGATDLEDDAFDSSWFDSSRALAQGLSVTEHDVGIEVLLRCAG